MESQEQGKKCIQELLRKALLNGFAFKIEGVCVVNAKITSIIALPFSDNDHIDGDHSITSDARLELTNKTGKYECVCKVRIDFQVNGNDLYIKYPFIVESHNFTLEQIQQDR